MLEELSVRNYALIEQAHLTFGSGFNVLTGETGAGKSILVGALSLLYGGKADTEAIRTGSDEAVVSGVFVVDDNAEVGGWLSERGIEPEDGRVVVRRTVKRAGRGPIYLQSTPTTRAELAEFSSMLLDLHGQHEHQSLLSEDQHRRLLDRYAGIENEVDDLQRRFQEMSAAKRRYDELVAAEQNRERERELLEFAVTEIAEADLKPGEEEELDQERRILSQHEKLFAQLDQSYAALAESHGGALLRMREARSGLAGAAEIDDSLADASQRLDSLFYDLEDLAEELRGHRQTIEFTPERLEACEDRLALIHRLEKKYGAEIGDVLRYHDEAQQKLTALENFETEKAALADEIAERERDVRALAQQISKSRADAAERISKAILEVLQTLGMAAAQFEVRLTRKQSADGKPVCGPTGLDAVAFMIAPNTGEPLKPLRSIASGGEISRVMLAIKTILAASDSIGCLVFDEVDAGIGGEIAVAVGEHLQALSGFKQVLCITHLATIAARADNHIRVEKRVEGARTVTRIGEISGDQRKQEIARMLAGDREAEVSLSHAEELLLRYREAAGE